MQGHAASLADSTRAVQQNRPCVCTIASFAPLPHLVLHATTEGLPLPAAAAHYAWLARQYQAAADMIAGRVSAAQLAAARDCTPAALLASAAQLAVRRRAAVEGMRRQRVAGQPGTAIDAELAAAIKRGRYLGQLVARTEGGVATRWVGVVCPGAFVYAGSRDGWHASLAMVCALLGCLSLRSLFLRLQ